MPKKALILVIIILFVGASVLPNISGYEKKTNIQSNTEKSTDFPLNDDYVNAYWKFDDCSGITLSDSSGNDYDGIISGATWNNLGQSDCALFFDGVDDYVLLDDHAGEIGFNKTDDLIYSFSFKSTGSGLIFSSTASWGSNPEFRIELLSNGSLFLKAWTSMCGISLTSSSTYNDGDWHDVEFYFNGITANPTVTLYVDSLLDNSITHWLCEIENDDFARAKMGLHAHDSSDPFTGYLDEFKIIKYEQGNEQEPPIIDGPTNGDPDVEYDFTFTTNDPEEDDIWIHIDWGNGDESDWLGPYESGEEVVVSYAYEEEGAYEIRAESKDIWHDSSWSDRHKIFIGNAPPNPPDIDGPNSGEVDETLTYTFVAEDYDGDQIKYFIDWGDENTEWTDFYDSGEEITLTHSWDNKGDFEITSKAEDILGNEGDLTEPYPLRIGDEPPNKPEITGPEEGTPGGSYNYDIAATDPEGDKIAEYTIDWDDGTGEEVITGPFASGKEITASHTWSSKGTYQVKAKAKDIYGKESNWGTFTVTMPRNRALNLNLLELLLERFQHVLMTIQHLMQI